MDLFTKYEKPHTLRLYSDFKQNLCVFSTKTVPFQWQ